LTNFSVVQKSNKHEIVASALEEAIISGELKVGEKLPSEQALAAQFGVSRNIVREALRDVKARGLIEVKNGAGSFITRPTSADLGEMLNRLIILSDSAIKDYYEMRFALEVKACELAAQRATEEDLRGLKEIIEKMKDNMMKREELGKLDFEFHSIIAKATKNYLFRSLLQPLESIMTYMFDYSYSATARKEALEGHIRLFNALKKKNPELAGKAMEKHLENSEFNFANLVKKYRKGETPTMES